MYYYIPLFLLSFVTEDGTWNAEPQKIVMLGVLPVRSLLVLEDTIWAASGGQIFIINTETHAVEVYFIYLFSTEVWFS